MAGDSSLAPIRNRILAPCYFAPLRDIFFCCREKTMLNESARPAAGARIPVKLHRRVCLIQTEDAVLAEELLARKKLAQDVVGRLTDRVLLVRPGRVESVIQELQRMGHTPQVVAKEHGRRTG